MNQSVNLIVISSYVPFIKAVDLKLTVSILVVAFHGLLRNSHFMRVSTATLIEPSIKVTVTEQGV